MRPARNARKPCFLLIKRPNKTKNPRAHPIALFTSKSGAGQPPLISPEGILLHFEVKRVGAHCDFNHSDCNPFTCKRSPAPRKSQLSGKNSLPLPLPPIIYGRSGFKNSHPEKSPAHPCEFQFGLPRAALAQPHPERKPLARSYPSGTTFSGFYAFLESPRGLTLQILQCSSLRARRSFLQSKV